MSISIRHVTIDCADPFELAGFWHQVTGWPRSDQDFAGDPEASLIAPDGATGLWFQQVAEVRTHKNRVHFDIAPHDHTRDEEVSRLISLGATFMADHRRADGSGWVVLADPAGNEFCVLRSAAERGSSAY